MGLIEFRYNLLRLVNMIRYKGLNYAFSYFCFLAFYNSDFISEKILYPLFPRSVSFPRYIEVEVSTYCNLRCKMCEHSYWHEKAQHMNYENFVKIVEQFPSLRWIGLTGIGESFLNPNFSKILEYVKGKNLYLELYDNFYLINNRFSKLLVELGIDRMIVSLEAVDNKTYKKLRPGSNLTQVIKNIKGLIKLKKEMNACYPEIVFHFIVSKYNQNDLLKYLDLVKKLMGQEKTSILFTGILHAFPEIEDMIVEITDELVNKVNKRADKLGIRVTWNRNIPGNKDLITKCNEWTMPFIFVDGTVIPCCATNEANLRSYQRKTAMGNIFKEPFKKIWHGSRYNSLRKTIHEGITPAACKYCTIYKVKND